MEGSRRPRVRGPMTDPRELTCVTWNVHRGVGMDGRRDPGRVVDAVAGEIAAEVPDIFVLQEADEQVTPHAGILDLARMEAATGLVHAQSAPELRGRTESHGFQGNVVLLHPRLSVTRGRIVDLPGLCPRGAVVLDLAAPGAGPLRLVATHLSLAQWLRAVQLRTLGQHLARAPAMRLLLVGDLNEWRPWGGLAFSRRVVGRPLFGPVRATFPSPAPVLPLDRILGDRPGMVRAARVLSGQAARAASDHLPLLARLCLMGGEGA